MKKETTILIAEDDDGHAALIKRNLKRAGIMNSILRFKDGQAALDFLLRKGDGPVREPGASYLLLLDIRMPKVDGTEVLRQVKAHKCLKRMPVIVITTTDDPREVEKCHDLGCNSYVKKPVDYDRFVEAIRHLGLFLLVIEVPEINEQTL